MSKYKELINLIENNNLKVKKLVIPDGFTLTEYHVTDNDYDICSVNGNGFGFSDQDVDDAIRDITKYVNKKKVSTLDDLLVWLEENAKK